MNPRTFLKNLWLGFATLGSVIAIASLFDDLIAWVDFIITAYTGSMRSR